MPYTPTVWVNNQAPALSAANLNKLTNELESQAAARSISHTLPNWVDGAAPALTDAAPLNEMERVLEEVAADLGFTYSPTVWSGAWSPARNAANLNKMEQRAQANRAAIESSPATYDYWHNYTAARGQTTPPNYGWNWGMQMGGVLGGTGPANFVSIIPDGIEPGLPSLRITVSADTYNDAVEGLYRWPLVMGVPYFYGQMIKFPTNWVEPGGSGWGAAINQLAYQGCVNHTVGSFAHATNCWFVILSGEQTWPSGTPGVGSPAREYNTADLPGGSPIIISDMALGQWHQLIYEIQWSTCSTNSAHYADIGNKAGHARVWHRLMGETSWTLTCELLNIPTLQWGYCVSGGFWSYDQTGSNTAHKFGLYSSQATFPRVLEHGNIVFGPTFGSVSAMMP